MIIFALYDTIVAILPYKIIIHSNPIPQGSYFASSSLYICTHCNHWIKFSPSRVQPLDEQEKPATTGVYVRTGLLGFVGTGGLVFICGNLDGLIQIGPRRHNTEDLIATVMAVEPHSFVYKGRYVWIASSYIVTIVLSINV